MKFKKGVVTTGVSPEIWFACGVVDTAYTLFTEHEAVVTSMKDSHEGRPKSLHNVGRAVDFRTRHISEEQRYEIYRHCRRYLDPRGFDTMLEEEPPHLHIEYDPAQSENFEVRLET